MAHRSHTFRIATNGLLPVLYPVYPVEDTGFT